TPRSPSGGARPRRRPRRPRPGTGRAWPAPCAHGRGHHEADGDRSPIEDIRRVHTGPATLPRDRRDWEAADMSRRLIGPVDTIWLNMDRPNNLMVIDSLMFL